MEQLLNQVMEELRKNAILMRRSFHGMSGRPTLHPGGQGRLLTLLLENPGISQKTLCQLLHVRPQTMGEQLSKLESAGLAFRKINPYDRRVSNFYLTEAGTAAAGQIRQESETNLQQVFSAMTREELETLLTLVSKLNDAIAAQMEPSPPPFEVET